MNRVQRAKLLHELGCLIVLVGVITLTILSFTLRERYFFGVIALIVIYVLILRQNAKKDERLFALAFDHAFESFQKAKPTLQIRNSYGFPHFTITFQSENDMNQAEADGHLNTLKSAITELCNHCGDKRNPFDVERAVYATYVGRRYSLTAE